MERLEQRHNDRLIYRLPKIPVDGSTTLYFAFLDFSSAQEWLTLTHRPADPGRRR